MNKKITAVTLTAIMVLTMFTAMVPAASGVTAEQVAAPYEFFGYVNELDQDFIKFDLNSEDNPSILYYDFDEGEGNETLNFTVTYDTLDIEDDNFTYTTTIYDKDDEPFIAWLGEPFFVVEAGSDWYLSKLLVDEDEDDSTLLRVGESLNLAQGFAITPLEIDVEGGEAWFSITQDGEEVDSSIAYEWEQYVYEEDLNESGDDDNWVLRFNVETVFAGMNTNLVKINATQLVSPDVTKIETPDDELFTDFEVRSEDRTTDTWPGINADDEDTLEIKLEDDDEISLKKDGIVSFLGDRFNFRINEEGDIGGIVVKITEPGYYELFAEVRSLDPDYIPFSLNSKDNPSILYYDFDEGEGNETLNFTVTYDTLDIEDDNFTYTTTIYDKDDEPFIAWLGEPFFVVEAGSDWYLSKLLVDEDEDDSTLLRVGESLNLAQGFAITPLEIDVEGGEAWFSITQDGEEVDSSIAYEWEQYVYEEDLNESGDDDNWVLRFNVETVFAGMNTNLVKINATQLVSPDVTKIETPDDELFTDFEVRSEDRTTDTWPGINADDEDTLEIKLEDDDEISLKKDGIVSFLGDRFNFRINEDGDIGGVLKVVQVGEVVTPTPTEDLTVEPTVEPTNVTGVEPGAPTAAPTDAVVETEVPTPEPTPEPGFEAVFAVAGLLAVAYLVLRQRE